jgi:hypothetical protein
MPECSGKRRGIKAKTQGCNDARILSAKHGNPSLLLKTFQSILECMATTTARAVESTDLAGGISRRAQRLLRAQVEDWHDECRRLSDWEDQHLLEHPSPERLAEHARLLGELERVGTWLSLATGASDFPDRPTSELVAMTLQDLKDARALWHGNMNGEHRQEILRAVFNEP